MTKIPSLPYTSTLKIVWDAHLLFPVGTCTEAEQDLHIKVLEMKAVQLAEDAFQHQIMGKSNVLMSDNATVVACIKKRGTVSGVICDLAKDILNWAE